MSNNKENTPEPSTNPSNKKGTPKIHPQNLKNDRIVVRINKQEREFVEAFKAKHNINNLSHYILKLLKNPQFSSPKIDKNTLDVIHIQQVIIHLSRIGNNVNQIAKMLNSLQGAYTSSQILEKLSSIENQLSELQTKITNHDSNNRKEDSL